jgi:hypothetical protein
MAQRECMTVWFDPLRQFYLHFYIVEMRDPSYYRYNSILQK